ncbi:MULTISPECIES: hypothetical protein [unclassified Mesorhizobium]|uniref:hypothetical protein n=1 Tax=unclassified Mesorhizobium TaxID=325217 RepID=UPI0016796882|nr:MULTISPECIES: hypothetical protein [unclassified Mesorhizobium]
MPDVALRKKAARAIYTALAKKTTGKISTTVQEAAKAGSTPQPKRLKSHTLNHF